MDSGDGRFVEVDDTDKIDELRKKYQNSKGIFTVGEKIEIKGSLFQVKKISPFYINLKLLKQQ